MNTNFNQAQEKKLESDLKQAQNKLERLEAERKEKIPQHYTRIKEAKQNRAPEYTLKQLNEQLDNYDTLSQQSIAGVREAIKTIEDQIKQREDKRRQAAQVEMAVLKDSALRAWLDNGGSKAGFDATWGEMETEILKKRAMEAVLKSEQ